MAEDRQTHSKVTNILHVLSEVSHQCKQLSSTVEISKAMAAGKLSQNLQYVDVAAHFSQT